jgi:hypothetical protein
MPTDKELEALNNPLKVMNEHLPEIIADSHKAKQEFFAAMGALRPGDTTVVLAPTRHDYQRGYDDGVAAGRAAFLRELTEKLEAIYDRLGDASSRRYDEAVADLLADTCAVEESDSQSEVEG